VLSEAAAASGPMRLELGPLATFLPANPVLYLRVGGDVDRVRHLRDEVFRPPLLRPLTWPFVPHVTVADDAEPDRIESALDVLRDYTGSCQVTQIHLLQERPGRIWEPIAAADLGQP
jgi:2'-5' RNA ligase